MNLYTAHRETKSYKCAAVLDKQNCLQQLFEHCVLDWLNVPHLPTLTSPATTNHGMVKLYKMSLSKGQMTMQLSLIHI